MRILHTSDWHVGRTVRGRSRADEHRAVLAEIARLAHDREVDLVLVAGDQFDTGAPSAESERIVYRALLDLADTGAQVVVLAGNHDNPRRWAAVRPLLELGNVHLADRVAKPDAGGVLDLRTRSGEVARVALVPFLSQRGIVTSEQLMAHDAYEHAATYAERAANIVAALTADFGTDTVNLVVGHLTVAGGGGPSLGGGERAAHTIFDYVVPPQVFPSSAHYVALGHLHLPHRVPGPAPIWYCGSPLHLDFGEADRGAKAVLVVDVTASTPARVEEVPLSSGRRMRTLRGTLEQVLASREAAEGDLLRVVLDEAPRPGLADDVRSALPDAVDVTVARREDEGSRRRPSQLDVDALRASPVALFAEYLDELGIDDPRLPQLFQRLLEEAQDAERDDPDARDHGGARVRPLRVELEGIGSFQDPTVLDLAGVDLFALSGPTGAGKTTLLVDAMMLALYGTVPRYDDRRLVAPIITRARTRVASGSRSGSRATPTRRPASCGARRPAPRRRKHGSRTSPVAVPASSPGPPTR